MLIDKLIDRCKKRRRRCAAPVPQALDELSHRVLLLRRESFDMIQNVFGSHWVAIHFALYAVRRPFFSDPQAEVRV
jgi:hypothetical protein